MKSQHLEYANQTYMEHFKDSTSYAWKSLKASFYFTMHAFFPDCYEKNGSNEINELHIIIRNKYRDLQAPQEVPEINILL